MVSYLPAYGLSLDVEVDSVSCNGASDGKIIVRVSEGTAPFIFTWSTGQKDTTSSPVDSLVDLGAGNYWVVVDDASGISAFKNVTVYEPDALSIDSQSKTDISCNGADDGTITLTVSGGTSPYFYSIDGGTTYVANGGTFTGLPPGSYIVKVHDAHGCQADGDTLTLTEPLPVKVSVTAVTDATCHGAADGTVTLSASDGYAPYEYSLDGGGSFADNGGTFTGLAADTYATAARDAHGCVGHGPDVTVGEPPPVTLTVDTVIGVSCHGGSDGEVHLTGGAGVAPYEYSLDGGKTFTDNGGVFTGLSAGTYVPAVRDAHGCTTTGSALTVDEPPALTLSSAVTDVTCHGAGDGRVTLTAAGGTPPYRYSLDGGTPFLDNGGVFTGLAPGSYYPAVRDAHGCVAAGATVLVNEPPALTLTVTAADVTCHGAADGKITLTAGGGTPPYRYSIDGGAPYYDNGGVFTGLGPGDYDPAVQDAHGCVTAAATVRINEPPALTMTASVTAVTCPGGSDGRIVITAAGGTPPYRYSLDGDTTFLDNGGVFAGLAAGTYRPAVQDAHGCTVTGSALTVTEPPALGLVATVTDVTCHGAADGGVTLTATGGTAPYRYSLDGGNTFLDNGGVFTGLSAGRYVPAVRDDHGCGLTGDTLTVAEPAALALAAAVTDISCHGAADGRVTLTATGGTPPYRYSIDGGRTFTDNGGVFTGLSAGTYVPAVRDAHGCTAVAPTVRVSEPALLVIDSVTVKDARCAGEASGQVRIYVSGGTPGYRYSLDGGRHEEDNGGLFAAVAAGTYDPYVSDAHGCTAVAAAVTVGEPAPLTVGADTVRPTCDRGSYDGEIRLSAGGGTAPYLYSVDGGVTFSVQPLFTGLEGGTYQGVVKDDHGCVATLTVMLEGRYHVVADAGRDTSVCPGGSVVLRGAGGDTYAWTPAEWLDDPSSPTPVATPAVPTDFILTVSSHGCSDRDTVHVGIFPVHGLDAGPDTSVVEGGSVVLQATEEGFVTWSWSPAEGLDNTSGPRVTARPAVTTVYHVEAVTVEGCYEHDSVVVEVVRRLFIPSGFTPNGDGTNDTWHFGHGEYYPDIVVEVFNRWGKRVFYSRGYDSSKEWDGTYRGKALPSGTYYYVIRLNDIHHTPPLTGPVTIIR